MNPENNSSPENLPQGEEPMEDYMVSEEFIEPLRDLLPEEDIEFLKEIDSFQAINYLYFVLPERSIEDVDAFLIEKGLLEPSEAEPED